MTQPEALRLADALDAWDGALMMPAGWRQRASDELRRLYAVVQAREDECDTHSAAVYEATRLLAETREQRDALLEALKVVLDDLEYKHHARVIRVANDAIAKTEEKDMNITVDRAVIEQALEALVAAYQGKDKTNQVTESITALRTALEQQYMTNAAGELEPVTLVQTGVGIGCRKETT